MAGLSSDIERFIKALMEGDGEIELKRNELAQHFGCAPSQINYVLATRFSVNHGYIIESRRGGGGYVKVVRVALHESENPLGKLTKQIGTSIGEEGALAIIQNLLQAEVITRREAGLMGSAMSVSALALPINAKDVLRAAILKAMIEQAFRNQKEG